MHGNMLKDFLGNTSVFYDENSTKLKMAKVSENHLI